MRYALSGWGGSNQAHAAAARAARARLDALLRRVADGADLRHASEYEYGTGVVREEWLSLVAGAPDAPDAVVTRNRYGAPVLNSRNLLIADIDFPPERVLAEWARALPDPEPQEGRPAPPAYRPQTDVVRAGRFQMGRALQEAWQGLSAAWKRRSQGAMRPPALDPQRIVLARVRDWALARPDVALRAYRTPNGLRLLRTDRAMDPGEESTVRMFEALGVDALYRKLCQRQACFRARLGPKPWRVGLALPPGRFPRPPGAEPGFEDWLRGYTVQAQMHAACAYLESFGGERVAPELKPQLEAHDALSAALSGRPLA